MMLQLGLMVLQGIAPRLLPVNTTHKTHNKEDNCILMLKMFKTFAFVSVLCGIFDQLLSVYFSVLSIHFEILTWPLVEGLKKK